MLRKPPPNHKTMTKCQHEKPDPFFFAVLGRFLQPDPMGVAGGLNLYAYSNNNPLRWFDPWGLYPALSSEAFRMNEPVISDMRCMSCHQYAFSGGPFTPENFNNMSAAEQMRVMSFARYDPTDWHYERNMLQDGQIPMSPEEALNRGWNGNVPAIYHQQGYYPDGRDASNNQKFVSPDGTMEVVYDVNGRVVEDVVNRGTYNYGDPTENPVGHVFYDVIPYYILGNGYDDPTSFYQRFGMGWLNDGYQGEITDEK